VGGVGVLLVVLLLTARPAWAHVELTGTSPADGAVVDGPVTEVTLTFSAPVKQEFSTVTVHDSAGQSYEIGTSQGVNSTVTQPVRELSPGSFTVTWRTVALDGHPLQGQFRFQVVGNAAAVTQPAPAPTRREVAAVTAPVHPSGPNVWAWLTWTGAALLAAAVVTVTWPLLRTAVGDRVRGRRPPPALPR
jgi:Uncharacterized protein, homolog of Cu resistance protein CopC